MKYGELKYGTFTYGESSAPDNYLWGIQIAWTGEFLGENEAINVEELFIRRGVELPFENGSLSKTSIGTLRLILNNSSKRYTPFNTSSPLFPNVAPGKRIHVSVRVGNEIYPLFFGIVSNLQMESDKVFLEAVEISSILTQIQVQIPLMVSPKVSDVVEEILEQANWNSWRDGSFGGFEVIGGTQTLDFYSGEGMAWDLLNELAHAVGGFVWVNGMGTVVLKTIVGSVPTGTISYEEIGKNSKIQMPWDASVNYFRCSYFHRSFQTYQSSPILSLKPNILIDSLQSKTIICSLNENFWMRNVSKIQLTANSQFDGKGSDVSSKLQLLGYTISAKEIKIEVLNTSTKPVFLTHIEIFGTAIYLSEELIYEQADSDSIDKYGHLPLTFSSKLIRDSSHAHDWGSIYQSKFSNFRGRWDLILTNHLWQWIEIFQTPLQLIMPPEFGGSQKVIPFYVEHRWEQTGQVDVVSMKVEIDPSPAIVEIFPFTFPIRLSF